MDIRAITTLDGCRGVVGVQEQVWGANSEVIPSSLLVASIKRGGILLGAYADESVIGFVWSLPGWRDGQRIHWSHMLGVVPAARGSRVGEQLKWAQRGRAIAQEVYLIEWTFDPLQALNAHLNLHRGTPTDRLIAEWWIDQPHVLRRRERAAAGGSELVARSHEVREAPAAIRVRNESAWDICVDVRTDLDDPRVLVPIPGSFGQMQASATGVALEWRRATAEVFQAYFGRGYRAVDFFLNRERGSGEYLLAKTSSE
jgi:chorismate synthase